VRAHDDEFAERASKRREGLRDSPPTARVAVASEAGTLVDRACPTRGRRILRQVLVLERFLGAPGTSTTAVVRRGRCTRGILQYVYRQPRARRGRRDRVVAPRVPVPESNVVRLACDGNCATVSEIASAEVKTRAPARPSPDTPSVASCASAGAGSPYRPSNGTS
jgi:hypothetical protein